jgi:hypothetical protein
MMGAGAAHYDLSRWGMEIFRASPRQADLMIVAGRVSQKMAPVLRQVYDQMVEPTWVISMGVCASSGGMFNNYAIVQGVFVVLIFRSSEVGGQCRTAIRRPASQRPATAQQKTAAHMLGDCGSLLSDCAKERATGYEERPISRFSAL